VRAEFRRAGDIISADLGPCFIDRAGAERSIPVEKGASLQQVPVVLGYEAIPRPYAVLFLQDVKDIGSPSLSPALSVLFCDVGDQIRETTLAATHACDGCLMTHEPGVFPLPASILKGDACQRNVLSHKITPSLGIIQTGSPPTLLYEGGFGDFKFALSTFSYQQSFEIPSVSPLQRGGLV
jgi:hypothetical protein